MYSRLMVRHSSRAQKWSLYYRHTIILMLLTFVIASPAIANATTDPGKAIAAIKNWFSSSTTVIDAGAASESRKLTISKGIVTKPVTILVSKTGANYEGTIPDEIKLDAILGLGKIPVIKKFGARNLKFSLPEVGSKDSAIFEGEFTFAGKNLYARGLAMVNFDKKEAILFTRSPKDHVKFSDLWGDLNKLIIPIGKMPLPPGMLVLTSTAFNSKIKDLPERAQSFFTDGGEVLDPDQPLIISQPGLSAMCRFDPADIHSVLKKIRAAAGVSGTSWFSIEVGAEGLVMTGHLPGATAPKWVPSILQPHWTDGSRVEMIIRISTSIECTDRSTMNIVIAGSSMDMIVDCVIRFSGSGLGFEIKGDVAGMWKDVVGIKGLSLGNGSISGGVNTWLAEGNIVLGMAGAIGIKDKTYDMGIKVTFEICPEAEIYGMPRAVTFRYECDRIGIGSLVDLLEVFVKGFIAHPLYQKLNELEIDAIIAATGGTEKEKKDLKKIVKDVYNDLRGDHSLTDKLGLNSLPAFELKDVLVFIDLPRIVLPGKEDPGDAETPAKKSAMKTFFKNTKDKLGKAGGLLAKTKTLGTGAALAGTLVLFDRELGSIDLEFTLIGGIKIQGEIKPIDLGVINIKNCNVDIGCGFKSLPHFIVKGDVTFFGGERKVDVEFSKNRIYFEDLVDLAELWKTQLTMEVVKKHEGIIQPANIKNIKVHGEIHEDAQDWFKHQVTDRLASSCNDLSGHLEEVKSTVPKLKEEVKELSAKIEALRTKFKSAVAKIEPAINAAKAYVDRLQSQIDQAQKDYDNTSKLNVAKRAYYKGQKYTLIALKKSADEVLDLLKKANKDVLVPFEHWSEAIPVIGALNVAENALDFAEHTISLGQETLAKTRDFIKKIGDKIVSVPFTIEKITFDAEFPKTNAPDPVKLKVKAKFGSHSYDGTATIIPLIADAKHATEKMKKQLADNAKALSEIANSMATGIFSTINYDVRVSHIKKVPSGGSFMQKIKKGMQIVFLQAQKKEFEEEILKSGWKF